MAESNKDDLEEGLPRRVDVELFILHPTLAPAEISAELGLEAQIAHRADDPRKTPKGALLEGRYKDTRWRHSIRYELRDQWFADKITMLIDRLLPHKAFFSRLRATGGRAVIVVQFFYDGYFGDNVPPETLAKMVDLQLDFGIECFA
jgi:hypothetical protein